MKNNHIITVVLLCFLALEITACGEASTDISSYDAGMEVKDTSSSIKEESPEASAVEEADDEESASTGSEGLSVSDDYKTAKIPPKKDPNEVWEGIAVTEYTGSYGIHFYVPGSWKIKLGTQDTYNDRSDYYSDDGGYLITTDAYYYKGNSEPFDWGQDEKAFEIGKKDDKHYFICTAIDDGSGDPEWDPDRYFPELSKYRKQIENTAWVEEGAEEPKKAIWSGEDVRSDILKHYTQVLKPTGTIDSFDIDDEYLEDGISLTVRYQLSDAEANEILANGGDVYPNEYCFTVLVGYYSGDVSIIDVNPKYDWTGGKGNYSDYDWNVWGEANRKSQKPVSSYILDNSDSCYLTEGDLQGLSKNELRLARNEIYARHGRIFKDEQLQSYFDSMSWYKGTISADDWKESYLNEYEKYNANFILEYENQ